MRDRRMQASGPTRRDVRAALEAAGLAADSIEPITGGWASWTFDVDSAWIARFPRNAVIADAAERELALLPELAEHVSFQVPVPEVRGEWNGFPFFAYRRIAGCELTAADRSPAMLDALAGMLVELHGFPVDRAAELLGAGAAAHAWRKHYDDLWPRIEHDVLPQLEPSLARRVAKEFERFVASIAELPFCLVHNDLGPEHVLISEATGAPAGIIDFESAWIGDPAVDLTPLVAVLGNDALDALTAGRDLGSGLVDRLRFYRWMGSVHAILWGVQERDDAIVRDGLERLPVRIAT